MANNILIVDGAAVALNLKTLYNAVANTHVPVHMDPPSNTATVATVIASGSTKLLIAANPNRLGIEFYNDSNGVAWVLRGTGSASNSNYSFQLGSNSYFSENPTTYTGAYQAIWLFANGAIQSTELT